MKDPVMSRLNQSRLNPTKEKNNIDYLASILSNNEYSLRNKLMKIQITNNYHSKLEKGDR